MIIYENEDLLKIEADMSVIPAGALSFSENALFVAEAVEKDFNEMFQTIGVNELAVFESTGMQIVYEGERLTSMKNTVIGFFQKMWAKIKAAFEAVMLKFESMKKETKKQLPEIKASDLDKLPAGKDFGKTHEFGELAHRSYGRNAADFAAEVSSQFATLAKKADITAEEVATKKGELEKQICSKVSGFDGVESVGDMTKAMAEKLMGAEITADAEFVKKHFSEIHGIVIQGSTVKHIKELYKTSRQYIDKCISTAKGYTDERAKVMNSEIAVLKSIGTCMNSANGKALDISKRRYNEYRNILLRIVIALKKKGKEGSTELAIKNEAAYASQLDMIDAAFNW